MQYLEYQEYDLHVGRRERLRLRIRLNGIETLKDHEIIEYLLYYAVPRIDMNDQAHALIDRFGSVGGVLHAELRELTGCGVSRRTAEWLCMLGDIMRDVDSIRQADNVYIHNLFSALMYGCGLYRRIASPSAVQLCLDKHGRVIYQREIAPSRAWGEATVLRDAMNDMISTNAHFAIILQFTGAEIAEPEQYDFDSAQRYSDALNTAGCRLNDVVLIGDSGSASLRQMDRIPQPKNDPRETRFHQHYLHEAPDAERIGFSDYLNMTDDERAQLHMQLHQPMADEPAANGDTGGGA